MFLNFKSSTLNVVERNSLFQNCVKEGHRVQINYLHLFLLRSAGMLNSWQISVNLLLVFAALRMRTSPCVISQSLPQTDHWLYGSMCVHLCVYGIN